jgi:hypothetical protein
MRELVELGYQFHGLAQWSDRWALNLTFIEFRSKHTSGANTARLAFNLAHYRQFGRPAFTEASESKVDGCQLDRTE